MKNMNVTKKVVSAALLMCLVMISVGSVAAINNGNQNGDLDREQLKDGSCDECFDQVADKQQDMLQEQTQSQLKDGSCCECVEPAATQQQDVLREQTKEQLKDGNCGGCVDPVADKQQDMLQEQTRERLRDGSCCDCSQ
jgi:hypothetical protein